MKGCKFIIYNLAKAEQNTYKPLIEMTPEPEITDSKQPIVLTFN